VAPLTSRADDRNARTHLRKQVAEIAASIRQFGFANPLLIDVNGVLIAGHGRLLAARSIGLDLAPTITLPHLSEVQRRALRLADNKIALNAGWDVDLLKLELRELADREIDFDLSVTGFSTGEIDVLLASKGDPDYETIPAVPIQPRTRLGDMWICGQHRVGCGDGRDLDFLRKGYWRRCCDRCGLPGSALQRPDQRPRERERAASRVRYGFRRDDGTSVPSFSFRSPRRLHSRFA